MNFLNAIRSSAFYLACLQLVTVAMPIITLPLLSERLGSQFFGMLIFSIAISQVLLIITDYGFSISATKCVSQNRGDKKYLTNLWINVTIAKYILSAFGLLVILIISIFIDKVSENIQLILISSLSALGGALLPQWFFQGIEKLKGISLIQLVIKSTCYLSLFWVVVDGSDLYKAAIIIALINVLSAIFTFPFLTKELSFIEIEKPKAKEVFNQLKSGWHVFISVAAISLYSVANAAIIGIFVSYKDLAVFHVGERIVRGLQSLYSPISSALFPYVSLIAKKSVNELNKINRNVAILFGSIFIMLGIFILIMSEWIVVNFFGPEFIASISIVKIMAFLPFFVVISNTLGFQTLLPLGKEIIFSRIHLSAAVISVLSISLASMHYGVNGSAIVIVIIEIYIIFLSYYFVRKIK